MRAHRCRKHILRAVEIGCRQVSKVGTQHCQFLLSDGYRLLRRLACSVWPRLVAVTVPDRRLLTTPDSAWELDSPACSSAWLPLTAALSVIGSYYGDCDLI